MVLAIAVAPAATQAFTATRRTSGRRLSLIVKAQQQDARQQLPAFIKPAALTVLSNVIMSLPAHAEAGKIFDFNFTLPVMAGQFLLLMVFLDKTWFGPVGKLLDERDSGLRSKLAQVKDNSADVGKLQSEAEKLIGEARSKAQKQIADAKAAVGAECGKELAAAKAKVDAELEKAMAALAAEKDAAFRGLDAQVAKLSADILGRVLPEGVKV